MMATNPKILELLKILSEVPARAAIIAPTIITDEMALVTDMSVKRRSDTPHNIVTNKN